MVLKTNKTSEIKAKKCLLSIFLNLHTGTCEGPIDPRPLIPILLAVDRAGLHGSGGRVRFPHRHPSQMSLCR